MRRTAIDQFLDRRYAGEQIGWDELWLNMAALIGLRSRCVRARVGAIVVTPDNNILGLGYNGPPAGYATGSGLCDAWCPRAAEGETEKDPYYHDCVTIHAEANCLLRARRPFPGGTSLYVNGSVCTRCALLIANAMISRVVMRVKESDQHRDPLGVAELLMDCGVEVAIIRGALSTMGAGSASNYRKAFIDEYGIGPHACVSCGGIMPMLEVVHHVDEDRTNNDPTNLAPMHHECHIRHHHRGKIQTPIVIRKIHDVMVRCPTCGRESTRAGMGRHRKASGH